MCSQFPFTHITGKCFIKVQTKLNQFTRDTPVAAREVHFLSNIDVTKLNLPRKCANEIKFETTKNATLGQKVPAYGKDEKVIAIQTY